jgi:hypothetical protein
LGTRGWGETAIGLRIGRELHQIGDIPVFLVHSSATALFKNTPFTCVPISDHLGPLLELLIEAHVSGKNTASIILADFFTASMYLPEMGLDPQFLTRYDLPVIALDIWNYEETGYAIDVYVDKHKHVPRWIESLSHRLIPVPIVRSVFKPGVYNALPERIAVPRRVRNHVRGNIGLAAGDRAVLFCTASWQQPPLSDEHGERMAKTVPTLLAHYLDQLGPSVHLVHVGPSTYPLREVLGDRYHWLPSLNADQFDLLVGSVDLLMSVNISATTNAKAIASGLPVIVLQNSCRAGTLEELTSWLPAPPSPDVAECVRDLVPLYPFSLWPLGFYDFLRPLLLDNNYCDALEIVELLDEQKVVAVCRDLLFSVEVRERLAHKQSEYVRQIARLPTALDAIESFLDRRTVCH